MFYQASTSVQTGSLEEGLRGHLALRDLLDALCRRTGPQFLRSFLYAATATLLCLLLGYPLAYMIAFRAGRWRNLMLILVIAPFFTSFLIRTLAWKTILSDGGPVVGALNTLHVLDVTSWLGLTSDDRLLATPLAVVCGLTYNFLPFMILPLYTSLERIDRRLHEAARDLYAKPVTTFRKVTFPLSLPGVVAGTLLTFIPASGDYVNAELLGSPTPQMIGNVIQTQFLRVLDYPTAAALSFILMADRSWSWSRSTSAGPGRRSWSDALRSTGSGRRTSSSSRACSPSPICSCPTSSSWCSPSTSRTGRFNYAWQQFSTGRLDGPLRRRRHVRLAVAQPPDRASGHARRDRARHDGRLRAGPLPLPGAGRRQLADLPADGHARGRHGRLAAHPVPQHGRRSFGFWTILIAHIMFCLSFVVTAVKARVMCMDPRLEQAARTSTPARCRPSCGSPCRIAAPGIAAGALLAFALSFDDFIITQFNAGSTVTFPMFVWGSAQRGTPVQINVIGTAMFLVAVAAGPRPASGREPPQDRRDDVDSRRRSCSHGPSRHAYCRTFARRRPARPVLAGRPGQAPPEPALIGDERCDLLVVGGGYSGLWTALIAKERDPGRDVVLIEGQRGGLGGLRPQRRLLRRPLTHGLGQRAGALARRDRPKLERARRRATSTPSRTAVARYGIDCDFERTGEIDVATEPHQVDELRDWHEEPQRSASPRARVPRRGRGARRGRLPDLPRRPVGPPRRRHAQPGQARLGPEAGLPATSGVRIYEHTPALGPDRRPAAGMAVRTPYGRVRRPAGRARHQRLPVPGASGCARTSSRSTTTR